MLSELTRTATGFSLAGSLFLARQGAALADAWLPGGETGERTAPELDRVTWSLVRQLRGNTLLAFQVGDALQRDLGDLLLPADPASASAWMKAGAAAAALPWRSLRFAEPDRDGLAAWQELGNKLQVYLLVRQVAKKIGLPPEGRLDDLPRLVERSYQLGDFAALWAVEGLGHELARRLGPEGWEGGGEGGLPAAGGLLRSGEGARVPAKSLTMLNAGIGLAFAERWMADLEPGATAERNREVVGRVLALCRRHARPGYEGAAIESLGLVVRTFHPGLVAAVDRALASGGDAAWDETAGDETARELYWHGVGRALYFLPINFLPLGDLLHRPFEMAKAEAPDATARRNALAGVAWAFTLVNMRQPDLLLRLLLTAGGRELAAAEGFTNGIASSLVMRTDTTPGSALVARFLAGPRRAPDGRSGAAALSRWDEVVRWPAEGALRDVYPRLRREGRLGEVFRFQASVGDGVTAP